MVFPSIRVYLDPPNWQQEPNQHQANGSTDGSAHQLLPPLPPQAQGPQVGSIRPGSMADRAQIAKIPPPPPPAEAAALKCPRCESTNTKFCYFNNYSLSQPRHFCKTCRRYWTRGGALRSVPVGGGCRRNKKSKRGRSKSPAAPTTEKHSPLPNSASAVAGVPSGATCHELIGQFPQPSNRGFMASLQNISRYGTVGNMGQTEHMGFPIGGGVEQWRLQQFPSFLSGFESAVSSASYPFQSDQSVEVVSAGLIGLEDMGASSRVTQMPPVKLEGSGGLNLIRSPPSVSHENNQYYSWTDLSGLASSSASHLL